MLAVDQGASGAQLGARFCALLRPNRCLINTDRLSNVPLTRYFAADRGAGDVALPPCKGGSGLRLAAPSTRFVEPAMLRLLWGLSVLTRYFLRR